MHDLALPFPNLLGVTFYDGRKETTKYGYKLRKVDYKDFDWKWYIGIDGSVVRAVYINHPVRVLASKHSDIPEHHYIIHNIEIIFAEKAHVFQNKYTLIVAPKVD